MRSNPFASPYLFHFHTTATDGELTLPDYFDLLVRRGRAESLVLLEHIRRQPTYDVAAFISQAKQLGREASVTSFVGFEAKLLPKGGLDITGEHLRQSDVIGIAEHGFEGDVEQLQTSFIRTVTECRCCFPDQTFVWVHPGLFFRKRGLSSESHPAYLSMLHHAIHSGVLVERNLRYQLISESSRAQVPKDMIVTGADVHKAADLQLWDNVE